MEAQLTPEDPRADWLAMVQWPSFQWLSGMAVGALVSIFASWYFYRRGQSDLVGERARVRLALSESIAAEIRATQTLAAQLTDEVLAARLYTVFRRERLPTLRVGRDDVSDLRQLLSGTLAEGAPGPVIMAAASELIRGRSDRTEPTAAPASYSANFALLLERGTAFALAGLLGLVAIGLQASGYGSQFLLSSSALAGLALCFGFDLDSRLNGVLPAWARQGLRVWSYTGPAVFISGSVAGDALKTDAIGRAAMNGLMVATVLFPAAVSVAIVLFGGAIPEHTSSDHRLGKR